MAIIQTGPRAWLAKTKFYPPQLQEDVIPRQHLLEELRGKLASQPLTLLSTPAGYGKTTLLAALPSAYPDFPLAWLSLDEGDNDPVRFLSAVIVALQRLNPAFGAASQSLLTGPANTGAELWQVMSVLINDALEALADPFALVLDDLHRVNEPSIFVALDYLLEHMPPHMHLVVGTRVDPPLALARLRARGHMAELRLAELRFSLEETATFLNDCSNLGLSASDLDLLQSRTEGWPVGLRLLASSLDDISGTDNRRSFIRHLAHTNQNIFDFLADEVFNHQEEDLRTFLLQTSILPELTPTLCRAVTCRHDAEDMLLKLYRRNLFIVNIQTIDSAQMEESAAPHPNQSRSPAPAYRYHDLFADFLRHRLQQKMPQCLPELHLRAARAEIDPIRVVSHYLAAAMWHEAADIIEEVGAEMLTHGYIDTISRWINTLPASVIESRPHLLFCLGTCAIWKGRWQEAETLLERALQGFEATGDEVGQGEVLVNLATIAGWPQSDFERNEALLDRSLTHPLPPHIRVQALLERASQKLTWGDWDQAEQDFDSAIRIQQSGELDVLHFFTLSALDPALAFLPGGLEFLEHITRQARDRVGDEVTPLRLIIEEMSTVLYLFRGQLVKAITTGEGALSLRERLGGHPFLAMDAAFFLIIAHAARGDFAAVEPLFDLLFLGVPQSNQPEAHLASTLFTPGRIRWLQGHLNEAHKIYTQMRAVEDPHREIPADRISRAWMGSLLDIAEKRYEDAERTLRRPEILDQKDRYSTIFGSTQLMLARLYWYQNRTQDALTELAPVLAYYEQIGIPFAILMEGQSIVPLLRLAVERGIHEGYTAELLEILGAGEVHGPLHIPQTGETLTPREVEVLRQIAKGVSNQTIAERLVIAESTVKTHAYHIFAKLDVSTRTQAAARARELRLL